MGESVPRYHQLPTVDGSVPQERPIQNGHSGHSGHSGLQDTKDSFLSSAQEALNRVQNHPTTQSFRDTVTDGPVAQHVKSEYNTTQNEFRNLANARTRPSQRAGTGQQLTHYHSLFYQLLSWENPRATTIAYLLTVASIFVTRYLPVTRTIFRTLYIIFGVAGAAELTGKLMFNNGFASQLRPRRYYTLPKGTIDRLLDDFHELLNFFVIEFQRIVFGENVFYTVTAFFTALISYYLTKIMPLWGLTLVGATVLYLVPLIYVSNREFIDEQLHHLSGILNEQATRAKDLAGQHTARATETVKTYAHDYSTKAQDLIGTARQRAASVSREYSAKAQDYAGTAKDRSVSAGRDYSAKAQDYAGTTKDRAVSASGDYATATQEYAGAAKDNAKDYAGSAKDTTQDYAAATRDYAGSAKDTTQDYAAAAKDRTAATANDIATTAQEYLGAAKNRVASATGYGASAGSGDAKVDGRDTYGEYTFPNAPQTGPTPIADEFVGEGTRVEREPLTAL